jgi:dihydropyrimidinase
MLRLIHGGTVINHDHSRRADVLIGDDAIAAVGAEPTGTIDAGGCYVMPGGIAITSANAARIPNVFPKKGVIAVGSDADVVVWDPHAAKTISAKKQVSRIDYNFFEGFKCTGLLRATLTRGEIAWLDGQVRAEAGAGKYVAREPFPAVHVANATWRELTAPRRVERVNVTP